MKHLFLAVSAVAAMGLVQAVHAAETTGAKFGYVDFQRALNEVEEGKRAKSQLKGEFDKKQRELETLQSELQKLQGELDKQRLILSADALKDKEETYRKKVMELSEKMNGYKFELQAKESRVTGGILNAMKQIVGEIGRKEGYTMILEKSQDIVLYSPGDSDLTVRVIREYNALPASKKSVETPATQ